ncbi:MAG: hypothetical protein ACOWWO_07155 [Peptococcaceae bacterium]
MKRILVLGIILAVSLTALGGCASKETPQKSEEELRKEIRAELEAEQKAAENAKKAINVKDKDALYDFVRKEIADISRENFDVWGIYYFDITGDGADEAVIVGDKGGTWAEKLEIISGDSGGYQKVPSDIPVAKYKNTLEFKDGFLAVTQKTGGTGEQMEYLSLYVYNGSGMVRVLDELSIFRTVAFPDTQFEETGTIDGPLTDFVYTLTRHDNITGEDITQRNQHYTYSPNTLSFQTEPTGAELEKAGGTAGLTPGIVDIKDLKAGSPYAGGTIQKISINAYQNAATFDLTLAGKFILEGKLQYSEFDDCVIFIVDKSKFPGGIKLSAELGTINPFHWPMGFRPQNILVEQLGQVTYNKLKNEPGLAVRMVVRAKDLIFSCQIPGQAGGNWELIEIQEIND